MKRYTVYYRETVYYKVTVKASDENRVEELALETLDKYISAQDQAARPAFARVVQVEDSELEFIDMEKASRKKNPL